MTSQKMKKKDIEEIMKDTCWGSLAYCCALKKDCWNRDRVIRLLNISEEEFINLKLKFDKNIMEIINEKDN